MPILCNAAMMHVTECHGAPHYINTHQSHPQALPACALLKSFNSTSEAGRCSHIHPQHSLAAAALSFSLTMSPEYQADVMMSSSAMTAGSSWQHVGQKGQERGREGNSESSTRRAFSQYHQEKAHASHDTSLWAWCLPSHRVLRCIQTVPKGTRTNALLMKSKGNFFAPEHLMGG